MNVTDHNRSLHERIVMTGKHSVTNKRIQKGFKLTKEFVDELFEYRDGDLYWKPEKAGTIDGGGYWQTGIKGRYFKNHRLIFLMHHGYLPDVIDHVDGDKTNNKIENLRAATRSENNCNTKIPSNNTSGVKGVSWVTKFKKWRVRIYVKRTMYHLGYFNSFEEAVAVSQKARIEHHKEFARER